MNALANLEVPGYSEPGLIRRERGWQPGDVTTGWWLTRAGRDWLDAPYQIATQPSLLKAGHVWDAADLGWQIESLGVQVLSEREISAGQTFQDGTTLEIDQDVFLVDRGDGSGRTVRPDMAIPHADGTFTAVEVERTTSRPLSKYLDKLYAYAQATQVEAVWYLCDRASIRDRVRTAWAQLVAQRKVVDGQIQLLVETSQHWSDPARAGRPSTGLARRTGWVGLPGIGLDGTILPARSGAPSGVGTRMNQALEAAMSRQENRP